MKPSADILDLVAELKSKGTPFAVATVVRTVSVTSAKAGAKAVIMGDGTITGGWIGGGCARANVLKAAREAIDDGNPRLLSVLPEDLMEEKGVASGDIREGVKYARNMCPSKGTMDIFIEAVNPRPQLVIFGASPVAVALARLAPAVGLDCAVHADEADLPLFDEGTAAHAGFAIADTNARRFIVIATQGRGDEAALKAAMATNATFVSFVGSYRKAAALREKLQKDGVEAERLDAVKAPAGLDLKAITPEEIALSVLAEIVLKRRTGETVQDAQVQPAQTPHETNVQEQPQKRASLFAGLAARMGGTEKQNNQKTGSYGEEEQLHPFLAMRCPLC